MSKTNSDPGNFASHSDANLTILGDIAHAQISLIVVPVTFFMEAMSYRHLAF